MRQYLFILLFLSALNAQNSSFNSFDVVIYPEYYFEGIMAEVDAEVKENKFPLTLRMNIPSSSDSVFFVGGTPSNDSNVKTQLLDFHSHLNCFLLFANFSFALDIL